MASLSRLKSGAWNCQVMLPDATGDKTRKTIRLPAMPKAAARTVKTRIEYLVAAKLAGAPIDDATASWLGTVDDDLHDRIARVGLTAPRVKTEQVEQAALGPFTDKYIESRRDLGELTVRNLRTTQRRLVQFFGRDRALGDVTGEDAESFHQWLHAGGARLPAKPYAVGTIERDVRRARQFFQVALRRKIIAENPFSAVKPSSKVNRDRDHFVARDVIDRVLDACPDAQWRSIIALSRYGALRCPSEVLRLRWADIDWARGRMRVRSTKTGTRQVPLFPELRAILQEAFDAAAPGSEYVIERYRDTNSNLRTQFLRIIDKAVVDDWPKLFQNMRATRETELTATYPLHVCAAWLGHSPTVAVRHYSQVTDAHFEQAAGDNSALQNALHSISDNNGMAGQGDNRPARNPVKQALCQNIADADAWCTGVQVPQAGFEPATTGLGNQCSIP